MATKKRAVCKREPENGTVFVNKTNIQPLKELLKRKTGKNNVNSY